MFHPANEKCTITSRFPRSALKKEGNTTHFSSGEPKSVRTVLPGSLAFCNLVQLGPDISTIRETSPACAHETLERKRKRDLLTKLSRLYLQMRPTSCTNVDLDAAQKKSTKSEAKVSSSPLTTRADTPALVTPRARRSMQSMEKGKVSPMRPFSTRTRRQGISSKSGQPAKDYFTNVTKSAVREKYAPSSTTEELRIFDSKSARPESDFLSVFLAKTWWILDSPVSWRHTMASRRS